MSAEDERPTAGGLAPTRVVLDNGITVIVKANAMSPSVSIVVGARTGAHADPAGKEGVAALCARVMDRGTVSRSADVIADDLDGRGASLTVGTGRHLMSVAATCLTDDFGPVLALTGDVVRHPAFADAEVGTRRADLITSIRQHEDQPASRAVDAFMAALYGAHPYARKVRGTVESVDALRRQDLVRCHQKGFVASGLTVVVVGDVDESAALDAVAQAFGDAPSGDRPAAEVPEAAAADARRVIAVPMMNKAQADIAYGFVGIRRSDPDYVAMSVMNNALGQYAIGGRLGDNIRERQGMAYYVFSSIDAGVGQGPLTIRAGVSAANVERTLESIDEELRSVLAKGFTPQEIDESKSYLVGSLPRQLETNAAIASFLLNADVFDLGIDYDVRVPALIQDVTLDAANAAARRLLDPDRATIAVAGPWTPP